MRFDWKDLALWCTCTFFLGMCVAPIVFLDANVAKWIGVCAAGLGGTIAIGGYLLNSQSLRLQTNLADEKEFRWRWNAFALGQTARLDIGTAIEIFSRLAERIESGEPTTGEFYKSLRFEGMNVPVDFDPMIHRVIAQLWTANQNLAEPANSPHAAEIPLQNDDAETLRVRIQEMEVIRDLIKHQYLDPMLPYFFQRGMQFEITDQGSYAFTGYRT